MLNSIHSDLIRGHIDTIILSVLHEGDRYGYDILGEIERKSGGEYVLKQPTLYSCLKRLETQGFIYKYWGTETNGGRRTYYSLTEMGKELFQRNKDEWKYSRSVIDKLISSPADPNAVIETVAIPADSAEIVEPAQSIDEPIEVIAANEVKEDTYDSVQMTASPSSSAEIQETEAEVASFADITAVPPGVYADVVATAEKDEILSEVAPLEYAQQIKGVSYSDRLSHEEAESEKREPDPSEINGTPFFAHDYFSDRDEELEDVEEVYDATADEDRQEDIKASYPEQAFYKEEDFGAEDSEQLSMFDDPSFSERRSAERAYDNTRRTEKSQNRSGVFKSYENAELSEETNREIVVGREYLGVIKRLLSGDTDADTYYSKLREVGATTASETAAERESMRPIEEQPQIVTEPQISAEPAEPNGANFDDLLVSVRSMGDEIRIRTHNRTIDKEYNSLYHFYANKLLLFKYGILFAVMILEIVIPYFIIKFGMNITPIAGELPVLVLSVVGAALLPIYAISAFLIDPYKRKRYDFDLKNSLLYRLGIMLLMLILVYAVNVVFYMDISFEAEYAFSLITPALLSTNIPLSAIVFKTLYDSKRFSAE